MAKGRVGSTPGADVLNRGPGLGHGKVGKMPERTPHNFPLLNLALCRATPVL